jgi:hypothetical protein
MSLACRRISGNPPVAGNVNLAEAFPKLGPVYEENLKP